MTITSSVSVNYLMIDGYALGTDNQSDELTVNSAAITANPTGNPAQTQLYQIGVANGEQLVAVVHSEGVTTRLLLEDAQGNILTQSDGQSDADGDDLISIEVRQGTYFVAVQCLSGSGTYTLSLTTMPSSAPFQTIPAGSDPVDIVAGDFTGNGRIDLAVVDRGNQWLYSSSGTGPGGVLYCWPTATARFSPGWSTRLDLIQTPS